MTAQTTGAINKATGFSAVIFDFDGTLVDTMPLHFRAYQEVLKEHGIALDREHFASVIGGKASETIPLMAGRPLTPAIVQQIHRRKKELLAVYFETEQVIQLRTSLLLRILVGRVPLALASAGSREGILLLLKRLGWGNAFGAIITGEDVRQGKPAPEAFLLAAARLGVRPEFCLVFEDTEAGIEAAQRAGMVCLDVRQPLGCHSLCSNDTA